MSMQNFTAINKIFKYINKYKRVKEFELPDRFKGTIVEKWFTYWRDVFRDYADVVKDASKEIHSKPWKGITLLTASCTGMYFVSTNPDEISFRDTMISYCNELIFIGSPIRNPEAVKHLINIEKCYNEGIIRRMSFGLFSVIWADNYNNNLGIYKAICPYMKPEYLKFPQRIVDIGFCNKWWILEQKMLDMDVNPEEWIGLL